MSLIYRTVLEIKHDKRERPRVRVWTVAVFFSKKYPKNVFKNNVPKEFRILGFKNLKI